MSRDTYHMHACAKWPASPEPVQHHRAPLQVRIREHLQPAAVERVPHIRPCQAVWLVLLAPLQRLAEALRCLLGVATPCYQVPGRQSTGQTLSYMLCQAVPLLGLHKIPGGSDNQPLKRLGHHI